MYKLILDCLLNSTGKRKKKKNEINKTIDRKEEEKKKSKRRLVQRNLIDIPRSYL